MNRYITFALVALAFIQLVNGQTACLDAQTTLTSNTTCLTALDAGTDFNVTCMGSCRTLFDSIINNCDNAVSCSYRARASHGGGYA